MCINFCGYFLGNFWKILGYFIFQRLVTLFGAQKEQKDVRWIVDYFDSNFFCWFFVSKNGSFLASFFFSFKSNVYQFLEVNDKEV